MYVGLECMGANDGVMDPGSAAEARAGRAGRAARLLAGLSSGLAGCC
jgi:hypothetical protein